MEVQYKRNRVYIWPTSVPCQPEYEYEPRVPDDNTQSPVAETPATSSSPPVMVQEQQSTPDTMEANKPYSIFLRVTVSI